MKKYRAGIAGVGFIGTTHIEALRRLGNVEVAAITDTVDAQSKADALFVPKGYTDYKSMIDGENLDSIHICTPNRTHYEMARYALEHGVNVVCEKPMTTTLNEAWDLHTLTKQKNLIGAVNFMSRFYPMACQMREMVRLGEVGEVFTVHGSYLQDWLLRDTDYNWRLEQEVSGESRAFADIGSHWIDLVEFVTGLRVVEVMADFAIFHKTRKKPLKPVGTYSGLTMQPEDYQEIPITTEDYASVLFHFENGTRGVCTLSQMCAGRKNQMVVTISGSKCTLQWDTEDSNNLWIGRRERDNGLLAKDPSILSNAAKRITAYPGGHVEGFPDTFKQMFRQFYAAISKNTRDKFDFATFRDGVREMQLNEKIIQSAKERRWIAVERSVE